MGLNIWWVEIVMTYLRDFCLVQPPQAMHEAVGNNMITFQFFAFFLFFCQRF